MRAATDGLGCFLGFPPSAALKMRIRRGGPDRILGGVPPYPPFYCRNPGGAERTARKPGAGPGAQGARREAERAEAEASILAGGLDEQHTAVLEAADARRRAPAAGAMEPLAMPDGTTMLGKHGSGGRVQACAAGRHPGRAPPNGPKLGTSAVAAGRPARHRSAGWLRKGVSGRRASCACC